MNRVDLAKQVLAKNKNLEPTSLTTPQGFSNVKKNNKKDDQPFWLDALNFVMRPQRAVTTGLANITDKDPNTTFLGGVGAGLSGKGVDFDEVMKNSNWKQREANEGYDIKGTKGAFDLFDVVNFAGNVLLDPLTYITLGGTSAVKAGTKAMADTASRLGKVANVDVSDWTKVAQNVYKKEYDNAISRGLTHSSADGVAKTLSGKIQRQIDDAGKAARATNQNNLINFDIPLTNITKGFGSKPKFLKVVDEKIGGIGGKGVLDMLNKVGFSPRIQNAILNKVYGVSDAKDMTIQMLNDLKKRLNIRATTKSMDGFWDNFVADMGGRSAIGKKLNRINLFNPRTLRSDSEFVNQTADMLTDTSNAVIGRRKMLGKRIDELSEKLKDFTEEELKAITYVIENAFPKGVSRAAYLATLPDPTKVLNAVPDFKKMLDEIEAEELRSGVLQPSKVRKDYFPHVFTSKLNAETLKKYQAKYRNDPDIGQFIGRSSASRFSKTRKSFQTLSELQDKLDDLLAAKAAGNPTGIKDLDEKIEILSDLFERSPIQAVGKRYYASIRSVAMKDFQEELSKNGLIVYFKNIKNASTEQQQTFIRINKTQSDKLGIPEGSLIHPEVLDGLQSTFELFTDKGMQKVLNDLQNVTNFWKTFTTSIVPSHYWFNFVGNILTNAMAGVSLAKYGEAVSLLNKYRTNTLSPEEQILIKNAFDNGVLGQTSSADLRILTEDVRTSNLQKIDDMLQKVASPLRENLGDAPDHMFRLAHYLDVLSKTNSSELAAQSVRKHLFNYNELTAADKFVKTLVPFWNWTKNNIPLQVHRFLTTPRYVANYERIRQQTLGSVGEDENVPEWLKSQYAKFGENAFYNPRPPYQDLGTLTDLNKILGMQTPLTRIPTELALNKQFFGDKPVDYGKMKTGEYDPNALFEYFMKQTGLTSRALSGYQDITNEQDNKNILDNIRDLLIGKTIGLKE